MDTDPAESSKFPTPRQLAHLQATGKVTADEALAMQSGEPEQSEAVMTDVRSRHAKSRLDDAVAAGAISEDEAADLLRQVRHSGHAAGLRSRINRLTRKSRTKTDQS